MATKHRPITYPTSFTLYVCTADMSVLECMQMLNALDNHAVKTRMADSLGIQLFAIHSVCVTPQDGLVVSLTEPLACYMWKSTVSLKQFATTTIEHIRPLAPQPMPRKTKLTQHAMFTAELSFTSDELDLLYKALDELYQNHDDMDDEGKNLVMRIQEASADIADAECSARAKNSQK